MVDGAKFNSLDSGGHFKSRLLEIAAARKKNSHICVKHAVTTWVHTSMVEKFKLFLKKKWVMKLKLSSAHFSP